MKHASFPLLALGLASSAFAQGPDAIHYTFDGMDAANSAVPSVGDGTPTDIVFPAGVCGAGQAEMSAADGRIESNWQVDLGTSSWTIGMFIDLSVGGNGFQYMFGSSSTGGMRCFSNGFAGTDNIVLRTLNATSAEDVILPGGAPDTGPTHCVWSYDANTLEVTGYVDGVQVANVLQSAPIDYTGTAPDFRVMDYTGSEMLVGNRMDDFRIYRRPLTALEVQDWFNCGSGSSDIGTIFCNSNPNSTGVNGGFMILGSDVATDNNVTLKGTNMPTGQFGIFVVSMFPGFAAVGDGVLCLGVNIGRYQEFSQIQQVDTNGEFSLAIDLTQIPQASNFASAAAGETWRFQAWHRDGTPAASNFTDAAEVTFQ